MRTWRSILGMCALLVGGAYAALVTRSAPAKPKQAAAPAPKQLAASTDIEAPTPLTSKTITGHGVDAHVSYYYGFTADPGTIAVTITGRNRSSAVASALGAMLMTLKADRICDDQLGNTQRAETKTMACPVKVAQAVVLRLNLHEDTIDYKVTIDGPVHLAPPDARTPAPPPFEVVVGSTDIAAPTPLRVPRIQGTGTEKTTKYYYAVTVGPGEVTLTADGKNRPSGMTRAVVLSLRARPPKTGELCHTEVGNETRGRRIVSTCRIDEQQPAVLAVELSDDTIDWRAKLEGAVQLASDAGK
ncbi:MAG TPA: hypothetical protein VHT91_28750 [Kofleriaceae bacterium]|nr:hypothetical protein [Kofleriaceae bacterium]